MSHNRRTGNLRSFIVRISLLTVMSIVGMVAGATSSALPAWMQDSSVFKWTVVILCAFILTDILLWISFAVPDARMSSARRLDWPEIKAKGKGQHMQEVMAVNLKRTLYFQPLISLAIGWLLGWGIGKVVSIISFFIFGIICLSFFDVLRYWEANEKQEKKSLQN